MDSGPSTTIAVAGVILAAGDSSRMGRPKQLLPFRGTVLTQAVVATAQASHLDQVVIVTGAFADEVEAGLDPGDAIVVRNPDYRRGNMSSLECGAAAVPQAAGIMLLMGDNPGVTVSTIDALADRFRRDRPWAAVTAYEDRIAHPFVLSRDALAEASSQRGPKLLWRLLAEDATERVIRVAALGSAPRDINTPEDYARLLADEAR